jgi:hypothetical protein
MGLRIFFVKIVLNPSMPSRLSPEQACRGLRLVPILSIIALTTAEWWPTSPSRAAPRQPRSTCVWTGDIANSCATT